MTPGTGRIVIHPVGFIWLVQLQIGPGVNLNLQFTKEVFE